MLGRPSNTPPQLRYCSTGQHQVPNDYFIEDIHSHICLICLRNQSTCPVCHQSLSQSMQDNIRMLVKVIVDDPEDPN